MSFMSTESNRGKIGKFLLLKEKDRNLGGLTNPKIRQREDGTHKDGNDSRRRTEGTLSGRQRSYKTGPLVHCLTIGSFKVDVHFTRI